MNKATGMIAKGRFTCCPWQNSLRNTNGEKATTYNTKAY